jgi:hypothetical protein
VPNVNTHLHFLTNREKTKYIGAASEAIELAGKTGRPLTLSPSWKALRANQKTAV